MTVEVLLATYNSEKYLQEQLDSLLKQTWRDFRILIRDDGSTDATPELLKAAASAHPEKIVLLDSLGRRWLWRWCRFGGSEFGNGTKKESVSL